MNKTVDSAKETAAQSDSTTKTPRGRYFEAELLIPAWLKNQGKKAEGTHSPRSPDSSQSRQGTNRTLSNSRAARRNRA